MNNEISKILLDAKTIDSRVKELAEQIDRDYADKHLVMVCILKGSFMFFSDLVRYLSHPTEIEFMRVSSYGSGTVSGGDINVSLDIKREDLSDCDLLVIEDIIDSGRTLSKLVPYLEKRARSVKVCTLLDKPDRREIEMNVDYRGFSIPDEFVVGYGLDYAEKYRTLPDVCVLDPKVYS